MVSGCVVLPTSAVLDLEVSRVVVFLLAFAVVLTSFSIYSVVCVLSHVGVSTVVGVFLVSWHNSRVICRRFWCSPRVAPIGSSSHCGAYEVSGPAREMVVATRIDFAACCRVLCELLVRVVFAGCLRLRSAVEGGGGGLLVCYATVAICV